MRRNLRGLWRDTTATSLIETALFVPVLALLGCAGTDVALGFAQKLRAQQAADRAVQFAINAGLTTATSATIQTEAATSANVPAANVAVNFWLECDGVLQPDFNGTCASGSPARYVSVTVTDAYVPMFTRLFSVNPVPLQGFAEGRVQ